MQIQVGSHVNVEYLIVSLQFSMPYNVIVILKSGAWFKHTEDIIVAAVFFY